MRFSAGSITLACVLVAGCSDPSANQSSPTHPAGSNPAGGGAVSGDGLVDPELDVPQAEPQPDQLSGQQSLSPAPINSGLVALSPENSMIQFVGTHVGDDPKPRTGGFAKFAGALQVDAATSTLKSVSVEIETGSLWTQEGVKLTTHLQSNDFLDVREFPTATFTSTGVEAGTEGAVNINGEFTLHGVTKAISIPATVQFLDGGVTLDAEFTVNRLDFGIDFRPEQVVNEVSLTVIVGQQTEVQQAGPEGAGGE